MQTFDLPRHVNHPGVVSVRRGAKQRTDATLWSAGGMHGLTAGKAADGGPIKQFTACDPVAKWTCPQAFRRATAHNAKRFLDKLQADMPFPIHAIQVDGGAEPKADFERECRNRGIDSFELPPQSPRTQRTTTTSTTSTGGAAPSPTSTTPSNPTPPGTRRTYPERVPSIIRDHRISYVLNQDNPGPPAGMIMTLEES